MFVFSNGQKQSETFGSRTEARGNDSANAYNHSMWTWTLNVFLMDCLFFQIPNPWIQHNMWTWQWDKGIKGSSLKWKTLDPALRRCKWCISQCAQPAAKLHPRDKLETGMQVCACVTPKDLDAVIWIHSAHSRGEAEEKLHYTSWNQIIRHSEAECCEWGTGSVERAFIKAWVLF